MSEVTILVTIYEPNIEFLNEQLESISTQSFTNFTCVVSYDGTVSSVELSAFIESFRDNRFNFVQTDQRLGLYRHVEWLIQNYVLETTYFALADQDDIWLQNKLEDQVNILKNTNSSMVTSNCYLVDANLKRLNDKSFFDFLRIYEGVEKYAIFANHATGAGSVYKSGLKEQFLPFPDDENCKIIHDHWLYLVSVANSGCKFDEEIRWLYRQHGGNLIGGTGGSKKASSINMALRKMTNIFLDIVLHSEINNRNVRSAQQLESTLISRIPGASQKLVLIPRSRKQQLKLLSISTILGTRMEALRFAIKLSPIKKVGS